MEIEETEAERNRRLSDQVVAVREEDIEPYVPLLYVTRLFRFASKVVLVALVLEVIAGIALQGTAALLPLLAEVIQGVVLAATLWAAADVTRILIGVGQDVRAARVILGRISARNSPSRPGREK